MNYDDILPIGSIVKLKGGNKRLMIFGIKQLKKSSETDELTEYDYIGALYPEGNLGQKSQYLFNHTDVENIYFRGFEDLERQMFVQKLSELSETNNNK